MKFRVVITTLLLVPFLLSVSYAATPSAEDVIRGTSDKVIERLLAEKEDLQLHPGHLFDLIQELIVPHFDFPVMSRYILGKSSWSSATDGQRMAFTNQFKTLMVSTYAKALLEYSENKIVYLSSEPAPNSRLAVVKTELTAKGSAEITPIHYRLRADSSGEWKIIDIAVDGVSLVGTYRGSFASEIRKNGLDKLIMKLAKRNEKRVSSLSQAQ